MYVFARKSGIEVQFVMFIATKHASAGALFLSFSSTTSDLLDFHPNKTEQYLQTEGFVP